MGISLGEYLDCQCRDALGPVNRWYCSEYYGYEVTNPEVLMAYYIRHGGAARFRTDYTPQASEPKAQQNQG